MEIRFKDILESRLRIATKKFAGQQLTPFVLRAMKQEMLSTVGLCFKFSNHSVSPEVEGWLANQYFKRTQLLNNEGTILDLVIIKEYTLDSFSDKDIETLYKLFDQTDFFEEIKNEAERRKNCGEKTKQIQ